MKLIRFMNHRDWGVFGELYLNDEFVCFTVEKPWKGNQSFHSCVPHGTYKLMPWSSSKHPDTFYLFNPANNVYRYQQPDPSARYAILIHPANYAKDVEGCIGLGDNFSVYGGLPMVTNSKKTTARVIDMIKMHQIDRLHIEWREHIGE